MHRWCSRYFPRRVVKLGLQVNHHGYALPQAGQAPRAPRDAVHCTACHPGYLF